jgi:DnaK suppressor protein
MAEKKKKKPIRKTVSKNLKTPGKTASNAKPKTGGKKQAAPKKTVLKKTASKAGGKPVRAKRTAAQKPVPEKKRALPRAKKSKVKKSSAKTLPPQKPVRWESEEERRAALRKVLLQRRTDLLKEVKSEISKYIKGETRQLVDTALDDGDWSVVDLSEDISLRHLSTHRETLLKIDESLRKLNEGTYGFCEDCGDEISKERLNILPFAIYCIDCQERREKLEEMERREGIAG